VKKGSPFTVNFNTQSPTLSGLGGWILNDKTRKRDTAVLAGWLRRELFIQSWSKNKLAAENSYFNNQFSG